MLFKQAFLPWQRVGAGGCRAVRKTESNPSDYVLHEMYYVLAMKCIIEFHVQGNSQPRPRLRRADADRTRPAAGRARSRWHNLVADTRLRQRLRKFGDFDQTGLPISRNTAVSYATLNRCVTLILGCGELITGGKLAIVDPDGRRRRGGGKTGS